MTSTSTINVSSLLGVAFVIMKLLGIIRWSWWWVTAPFWAGAAFLIAIALLVLLAAFITALVKQ